MLTLVRVVLKQQFQVIKKHAYNGLTLYIYFHVDIKLTMVAGSTLDADCAVDGPMIVIRSSQRMGEKMVTILKQYMQFTEQQETQWQHRPGQGVPTWQLFDIVGDLGESVQQELLPKLSTWALSRSAMDVHYSALLMKSCKN